MKKFVILLCMFGMALGMKAQQAPQYSQYMFNHMALNPAYAGSWGFLTTTFIYRKQWVNLNGAPTTQSFALHAPSRNQRHGFGMSFFNDQIGVTRMSNLNLAYAYRIPLGGNATLALGLQGAIGNYNNQLGGVRTGSLITNGTTDPAFQGNVNVWIPNAGTGVFFSTKHFYLGLSAPDLIENNLHDSDDPNGGGRRHYFATSGLVIGKEEAAVKFKPSVLLKFQPSTPMGLDLNAHFLFVDRFWLGVSYRVEDAVVGMFEWQISPWFRIGYAYDFTLSQLSDYSSGSHEFMLGIDLNFKSKGMVSPRWF